MISKAGLTKKQERFVQEYEIDLNGTQAAIRAGYSATTARSIASENLQRPAVKKAIQKALRANGGRLQSLAAVAFLDPLTAIEWDPEKGLRARPDSNIIQSVRHFTRTDRKTGITRRITSIKFPDKLKALREIGRRLGAF